MRAPPDADTMISGLRADVARSIARVIASPTVLHRAHDHVAPGELAGGVEDGVIRARLGLRAAQALGVWAYVHEVERIGGRKVLVEDFVLRVVEQQLEPLRRADAEVPLALGADVQVLIELFLPDDLAAALALDPQAFRANALLARRFQLAAFSFEPGHGDDCRTAELRNCRIVQSQPVRFNPSPDS